MKNSSFERFARAFSIFVHFAAVLALSTTWNDQLYSWEDNVSPWRHIFDFFCQSPNPWYQFKSWILRVCFPGIITWNDRGMIVETLIYILRLRSRFRQRHTCLHFSMNLSSKIGAVVRKELACKKWVVRSMFVTRLRMWVEFLSALLSYD